jgi:hypothetical protein
VFKSSVYAIVATAMSSGLSRFLFQTLLFACPQDRRHHSGCQRHNALKLRGRSGAPQSLGCPPAAAAAATWVPAASLYIEWPMQIR